MTRIVLKPFKAAINFMMNKGCFEKSMSDSELADILDLYYQLCSLEVTVKSRALKYFRHSYIKRYELALLRSGYFIYFGSLI